MKLTDIEGLESTHASKLASAGIRTPHSLLVKANTPAKRRKLEVATGIDQKSIMAWVNVADLYQIRGIGLIYADLLEKVGVVTSKDLSRRNPGQLIASMEKVNSKKHLTRKLPSLKSITRAIEIATEIQRSSHSFAGEGTTDAPPPRKSRKNKRPRGGR